MKDISIKGRNPFNETKGNEIIHLAEEFFRIDYILYIVYESIYFIRDKFEQFITYEFFFVFYLI